MFNFSMFCTHDHYVSGGKKCFDRDKNNLFYCFFSVDYGIKADQNHEIFS